MDRERERERKRETDKPDLNRGTRFPPLHRRPVEYNDNKDTGLQNKIEKN